MSEGHKRAQNTREHDCNWLTRTVWFVHSVGCSRAFLVWTYIRTLHMVLLLITCWAIDSVKCVQGVLQLQFHLKFDPTSFKRAIYVYSVTPLNQLDACDNTIYTYQSQHWTHVQHISKLNEQAPLTLHSVTRYSCILIMITVLNSNTEMGAVSQACLTSIAGHIIVMDWTSSSTKESMSICRYGTTVT